MEDDIRKAIPHISRRIDIAIGTESESSRDIETYFREEFSEIANDYDLHASWPPAETVASLVNQSEELFIWATTLITFIREGDPGEQLSQITTGSIMQGGIDTLYKRILDISFPTPSDLVTHWFRAITGAIIMASIPLNHCELNRLLAVPPPTMLGSILKGLRSVMDPGDGPLRFHHKSFEDFLTDRRRCPAPFYIDKAESNQLLILASFRVMTEQLRFNICSLESSYIRNQDIPDLATRVNRAISGELAYACRFLRHHIQAGIDPTPALLDATRYFLETKLLFWIEVLSLLQDASASRALYLLAKWTEVSSSISHYLDLVLLCSFSDPLTLRRSMIKTSHGSPVVPLVLSIPLAR